MGQVDTNEDYTVGKVAPYAAPPKPKDDELEPVVTDPVETEVPEVEPQE